MSVEQESLEQRLIALQVSLESRLAAVEAENADLRAQLAGVAAAAGVAATAATLATNVPEAHAADGNAVLLGQTNTSTLETTITNDGSSAIGAALQVTGNVNGVTGN